MSNHFYCVILLHLQEDIDKWHAKYVSEVERIFNTYKKALPLYKDKVLNIE